jgi:NAD(P)-dependent dehydrogenase (short-subunit alcohol dehydrogenase family)
LLLSAVAGRTVETNLKGKTVLVTDAVHNVARPLALAFAREGATVFPATHHDDGQLAQTTNAVSALGVKAVRGCVISAQDMLD